jgi:hypothetical protein
MSDTNPLDTTAALGPETDPATSSCESRLHRAGPLMRAVIYTPMVLAAGALSAAVVFPELAEYASPLLDVSQPAYSSSLACSASHAEAPCCAHSQTCLSGNGSQAITTVDLASTTEEEVPADALTALEASVFEATSN